MVYYDGQVIANQVVYAAVGNWAINKIKTSSLIPFINSQTFWLNHALAIITSGIAAIGINYTYSYSPDGALTVVLTGLTIAGIYEGAKQWAFAYIIQQTGYNITKPKYDSIETNK